MVRNKFKVNFIGIGAAKTATNWIHECLNSHPEVCCSSPKETNFFNRVNNFQKGIQFYKKFFIHCDHNKIIGEFTPTYLSTPKVELSIYKYFPNIKIIVCLRNPIERAYSQYRFGVQMKDRFSIYSNFHTALLKDNDLIEMGYYYKHLHRYLTLFPKKNILILIYDDIINNPRKFVRSIYKFLDLKDINFIPSNLNGKSHFTGDRIITNKIPVINSLIYKFRRWIVMIKRLDNFFEKRGLKRVFEKITLNNREIKIVTKPEQIKLIPPISYKVRKFLYNIYKEDIKNLEILLDRDLSHWK